MDGLMFPSEALAFQHFRFAHRFEIEEILASLLDGITRDRETEGREMYVALRDNTFPFCSSSHFFSSS